jgi:hypothetical protein
VREGELSSALCHLAGISHRLGAQLSPDAIRERVKADVHAAEALGLMGEHLKRNDALPEKAVFGVPLKVDTAKEVIIGNPAAVGPFAPERPGSVYSSRTGVHRGESSRGLQSSSSGTWKYSDNLSGSGVRLDVPWNLGMCLGWRLVMPEA